MSDWKKFSVFPHWEEQFNLLSDDRDKQKELALAIIEYGATATEPFFKDKLLAMAFAGVRNDIDNSRASSNSNKGGRPKKSDSKTGVSEDEKPPTEGGVFEDGND